MVRNIRRFALLLATLLVLVGCSGTPASTPSSSAPTSAARPAGVVRVGSLRGPTTMGLVKLMADAKAGTASADFSVTMAGTADEIVPQLTQGNFDIALVPANLAAVLFARTQGGVQVVDVNTLGVLQIVENGTSVNSIADLAGRTIYSTGRGTSPQYVLEDLLRANGIDPATGVTIEYLSESTELVNALANRTDAVAVMPQPFVTILQTQQPSYRVALNLTEEWAKVHADSQLVTGVTVVRTAFATEHPDAVAAFLADHAASVDWVNENPAEAAPLIVETGIVPNTAVAEKAIPACNLVHLAGSDAKSALSGYLQVLYDANPESVGGALPGDDFYYGT